MKASSWHFHADPTEFRTRTRSLFPGLLRPSLVRAPLRFVRSTTEILPYLRRRLTLADADRRARRCPVEAERSQAALVAYLTRDFPELLAARALYKWIADEVAYDWDSYQNPKRRKPQDGETVFRTRLGVCEGISRLFDSLLKLRSIHSFFLTGSVKIHGRLEDHAWSGARIDGVYSLFDVTWGQGGHFEKYFLAEPRDMRRSHFPADSLWQLLNPPISFEEFKRGKNL